MDRAALLGVLQLDLTELASRLAELPRPDRQPTRTLLWQGFQAVEQRNADLATLLQLQTAAESALRTLVQRPSTVSAYRMRQRQPWPEILRRTLVADRVLVWQRRFDRRWRVPVALSAERLAWLEKRVANRAPTQVATVRQPDDKDARESLELLHKRGRSRFS